MIFMKLSQNYHSYRKIIIKLDFLFLVSRYKEFQLIETRNPFISSLESLQLFVAEIFTNFANYHNIIKS